MKKFDLMKKKIVKNVLNPKNLVFENYFATLASLRQLSPIKDSQTCLTLLFIQNSKSGL